MRNVLIILAASCLLASCNQVETRPSRRPMSEAEYAQRFENRAEFLLRTIAQDDPNEVMTWANQAVSDHHKYVLGPVIANLATGQDPNSAIRALEGMMEVNQAKEDRGLYHFAAYYRARIYLQYRDKLPDRIVQATEHDVKNWMHIMTRGGTENHGFMHRTSGYIFSEYIPGPYKGDRANQQWLEDWLIGQVRKFYSAGQGEYDSSTYVVFTAAGWTNVYDFTRREKMKKFSRAALEWLAAAQAVKYFHGCNVGPEARGFAGSAVTSNTDRLNWLWFDDSARPVMEQGWDKAGRFIHAVAVPAVSDYRPDPIIRRIARKEVPLPFEHRASKPQYYPAQANKDQEYLYVARNYAMGTLYSPEKGVRTRGTILPQTTMFKACLLDANDVRAFGMSNGYHGHFPLEGRTPYDQYHQKRSAALNICYVPREEDARTRHRSIFGYPEQVGQPLQDGGWYFWEVADAYLAARPLNDQAARGVATTPGKDGKPAPVKDKDYAWLISPGKLTGWAVQLGQKPEYATLDAFRKAVKQKVTVDTTNLQSSRMATMTTLEGDVISLHHTGGPGGRPEAWTNGKKLTWNDWPVFDSPYLKEAAGSNRLWLSDGENALTIDVSGEIPTFTPTQADSNN
ncbi:MAG: hypothetical protein ACLFVH_06320 [Phycisphaerae bacterium]